MAYRLFGKRWELAISDGLTELTFDKIDLRFAIVKTNDSTPNEADIEIVNLNAEHRDFIYRKNLRVRLSAGYHGGSGLLFSGNTELINHEYQSPDWRSKVYAKDGGAALRDLVIFKTFKKGTEIKTVIEAILKKLTSIPAGLQSELQQINRLAQREIDLQAFKPLPPKPAKPKQTTKQKPRGTVEQQQLKYLAGKDSSREKAEARKLQRGITLRGAAADKLDALCRSIGLVFNITDQSISIYPRGLALNRTQAIVLSPATGMLGSPEKTEGGGWKARSLLRFEFNPGLLVYLDSAYVQGEFLINRVEHRGDTVASEWESEVFLTEYNP